MEAARRVLAKTVCGAALWFDGLFGDQRNLESARQTSGRVELSVTESEYWGTKERVRFNVRMRLPNLERHVEAFAGHEDESDFVEDRTEGFALRSQFRALEEDDRWVAGLGYSVPGSYERRSDVRVGVHGVSSPELFVQGRHRRNWYVGEKTLWHFRQAIFWTNRDGFGTTTGIDFGRVLTPRLLFRWGNVGTFSESTDGVNYRTVMVLYRNLGKSRALALESFARGETDDEEPLREYGIRAVFRRPIGGKDWLFGELIGGYGWIKENDNHDREGSATVGFGVELLFGQRDPYRDG